MIEQTATVLAVADGAALLEVPRTSSCSACGHGDSCGTSLVAKLFGPSNSTRLRVVDSIGLAPGDRVVIGIRGPLIVQASMVAYLLPLIALLVGAAAGEHVGLGEFGPVLTGLLALAAGLWLAGRITGGTGAASRFRPRLLRREAPAAFVRFEPAHPAVGG